MIIAIVGTSISMSDNELRDTQQYLTYILQQYNPQFDIIISGGAKGIDTLAIESAKRYNFKTKNYYPRKNSWAGYKLRNIEIAKHCDVIYCITVPIHTKPCYHHFKLENHQKTAGCWTINKAKQFNKQTILYVIPTRI